MNFLDRFENPQKISRKSVQWEPTLSMRTDGQTDKRDKANSHFWQFCELAGNSAFRWELEFFCHGILLRCIQERRLRLGFAVCNILCTSNILYMTEEAVLGNDQLDTQLLYFTIRLLWSSTCFEHYMLIIRRMNCIDSASGIVTLSQWPSGARVERELWVSLLMLSVLWRHKPP